MTLPTITPLSNIPTISDPANFPQRADNFVAIQLPRFVEEANDLGQAMADALAEAISAAQRSQIGTSATSVAIGTGAKNFTTQAERGWAVGSWLTIASAANPTSHYMIGQITSYSGTALQVSITHVQGSGTRADWQIALSARAPSEATTSQSGLMSAADKTKLDGAAPLASPAFTGTPTAPNVTAGDDSGKIANTKFVKAAIDALRTNLMGTAPELLDTFEEFANALGDDPNFATTIMDALATKLAKTGGSYSGGFTTTRHTITHATSITPDLAHGHLQKITNSGAFTLNAPSGDEGCYDIELLVVNAASGAGAITYADFDYEDKRQYNLVANARFLFHIKVDGAHKSLYVVPN